MIPCYHPFIGKFAACYAADHVPQCPELVVLLEVHSDAGGTGTDVICERQRALPVSGRIRSTQVLQDRPSILIRQGSNRNLRNLRGVLRKNSLRRRHGDGGRNAGSGWIAGELEHVPHRAALHTGIRAPGAIWIFVSAPPAVIGGIGVNDDSRGSAFLRDKHFDSTEVLTVTHEHDLSAHVDFHLLQLVEIVGRSIIRVDHIGFDVAGRRHAAERHHYPGIILELIAVGMLPCGPVHFHSNGRHQIHTDFQGVIHPDLILDNFGIQPSFSELLRDVVGRGLVFGGACHVGILGQGSKMLFGKPGVGNGKEPGLNGGLSRAIAETEKR